LLGQLWRVPDFLHAVANSANVIAQPMCIVMEHFGALFDKDEAKHSVATLNCH
jgi:hypothetical protein